MEHEVVTLPAVPAIGLEIRTANERAHEIGAVWGQFMGEGLADQIPGRTDGALLAAYCDYEGDHTKPYTFFLGCAVAEGTTPPAGMVARTLPGGTFARIVSEGPQPETLMGTWGAIWEAGLARAFACDREVHDPASPTHIEVLVGIDA